MDHHFNAGHQLIGLYGNLLLVASICNFFSPLSARVRQHCGSSEYADGFNAAYSSRFSTVLTIHSQPSGFQIADVEQSVICL